MSTLSLKHRAMMEYVFEMRDGYVLGYSFTNNTFKDFILMSVGIDVYDTLGYKEESSKAKKLRHLVKTESDTIVGKVILDLLKQRDLKISLEKAKYDTFKDMYADQAYELRKVATVMAEGKQDFSSNEERLNADILVSQTVLQDLISACELVCNNFSFNSNSSENSLNDIICSLLTMKGYKENKDQTRHGVSANGCDAGEVDLLLLKDGKEIAIMEGLKLDSVNSNYIDLHINKAINNYNALGTPTFIVVYATAVDFSAFWERYLDYIRNFDFKVQIKKALSERVFPNAAIRTADMILCRDGYDFPVYYVAVNIRK